MLLVFGSRDANRELWLHLAKGGVLCAWLSCIHMLLDTSLSHANVGDQMLPGTSLCAAVSLHASDMYTDIMNSTGLNIERY